MDWVKKNTILLVSIAVSLVLLAGAGWFLSKQIARKNQVQAELDRVTRSLEGVYKRKPYPNDANIEAIRSDAERVEALYKEKQKLFPSPSVPKRLTEQDFQEELAQTIDRLKREAALAGTQIPPDFNFTFTDERGAFGLERAALKTMWVQLQDLEMISGILFDAKIHRLTNMRRSGATDMDNPEMREMDLVKRRTYTNEVTSAVVTPYEVSFRSYSGELAKVLNGFATADRCFLVKTVITEPVDEEFDILEEDAQVVRGNTIQGSEAYEMYLAQQAALRADRDNKQRLPSADDIKPASVMVKEQHEERPLADGTTPVKDENLLKVRLIILGVRMPPSDEEESEGGEGGEGGDQSTATS